MNRQEGNGGDGGKDSCQHGNDEQGGSVCGLGRGLSDAHGVDEGVRDEVKELHRLFDEELKR